MIETIDLPVAAPATVTSLIPFNPGRFDACMAYFAEVYRRPLTRFEMGKLHVMTDVYHVIRLGHQVVGGDLEPWRWGPFVRPAYDRLQQWEATFRESGGASQPAAPYVLHDGELVGFRPRAAVDRDDFSASEYDAMASAILLLKPMSFDDADQFFHGDGFMGRAYQTALAAGRPFDWAEVIDGYDRDAGTDHASVRRRLISYR